MSKFIAFLVGVLTGAGLTYVFDPKVGAARREKAREQVRSTATQAQENVSSALDQATDRLAGAVADALPDHKPENDAALVAKVRSEVLGTGPWSSATINVDAADGVLTLRGEVPSASQRDDLAAAVEKVTGVEKVNNLVHLPGETPANVTSAGDSSSLER